MAKSNPITPSNRQKATKGRPSSPFILFHMDNFKRCGGNYYTVALESGKKWRALSQAEKDKWYRKFYSKHGNTNSDAYKKWKKN